MILQRAAAWAETRAGLLCLFGLGLALRLVLARISDGLWYDVTLFRVWSDRLVQGGTSVFYAPTADYVVDYPPGYLYVLLAVGKVWRALTGGPPSIAVLKLPAIFADIGVAVLAALLAARILPAVKGRGLPIRAMAAAAILFNPGLILVSAVWGQVDSVLALLVMGSVYALAGPPTVMREACAIGLLAIGVATKPQAVFALPIVAIVLMWRHAPDGWSLLGRMALFAGVGMAVIAAMFVPFGVGPADIPSFFRNAGSLYPFTSLWAFNVWGAAGFYRPDVGPEAVRMGGIAAFHLGLAAFGASTLVIVVRAWQALEERVDANAVALFGAAAITCAAFALLTRSHERYLYLAVAGLAPFVGDRRFRWALGILSVFFLLNVHFVYVLHSQQAHPPGGAWTIQPLYDALFGLSRDAAERKALSVLTAAACVTVSLLGWRWLDRRAEATRSSLAPADGSRRDDSHGGHVLQGVPPAEASWDRL